MSIVLLRVLGVALACLAVASCQQQGCPWSDPVPQSIASVGAATTYSFQGELFALGGRDASGQFTTVMRRLWFDGLPRFSTPTGVPDTENGLLLLRGQDLLLLGGGNATHLVTDGMWLASEASSFLTFTPLQPHPNSEFTARRFHAGACDTSRCWIFGGAGEDGVALADIFTADDLGKWVRVQGVNPPALKGHTVTMFSGKLIIAGGIDASGEYSSAVYFFTILDHHTATMMSTARVQLQPPRAFHAALALGSSMLIQGGEVAPGVATTAAWTLTGFTATNHGSCDDPTLARSGHGLGYADGWVLAVGGQHGDGSAATSVVLVYPESMGCYIDGNLCNCQPGAVCYDDGDVGVCSCRTCGYPDEVCPALPPTDDGLDSITVAAIACGLIVGLLILAVAVMTGRLYCAKRRQSKVLAQASAKPSAPQGNGLADIGTVPAPPGDGPADIGTVPSPPASRDGGSAVGASSSGPRSATPSSLILGALSADTQAAAQRSGAGVGASLASGTASPLSAVSNPLVGNLGGSQLPSASMSLANDENDPDRLAAIARYRAEGWYVDPEELEVHERIAGGASAVVWRGSYIGGPVAVKQMFAGYKDVAEFKGIEDEARMLYNMHHPCIVQFFGAYARAHDMFLVTEWCPMSLKEFLEDKAQDHSRRAMLLLLAQIAQVIAHLHRCGVVHRDVKPANILIGSDGFVRVCDFGLARVLREASMTLGTGTPEFMAPEMVNAPGKDGGYSAKVDVYSFGILMWTVLHRRKPFAKAGSAFAITSYVMQGGRPEVAEGWWPEIAEIMRACWHHDPDARPGLDTVSAQLEDLIAATEG